MAREGTACLDVNKSSDNFLDKAYLDRASRIGTW